MTSACRGEDQRISVKEDDALALAHGLLGHRRGAAEGIDDDPTRGAVSEDDLPDLRGGVLGLPERDSKLVQELGALRYGLEAAHERVMGLVQNAAARVQMVTEHWGMMFKVVPKVFGLRRDEPEAEQDERKCRTKVSNTDLCQG